MSDRDSAVCAAVLTIGDEVLAGDIVDTNRAYIGQRCRALGLTVTRGLSVRDRVAEIAEALRSLAGQVDVCLVSGGLGPTTDDVTAQAVALALGTALERNSEAVEQLQAFFAARGRELLPTNLKQADLPVGSQLLQNPIGTAPGFWCELTTASGRTMAIACMPGVPSEMRRMLAEQVEPRIAARHPRQPLARRGYRLLGVGESAVQHTIDQLQYREGSALPWSRLFVHYRARAPEVFVELEALDGDLSASELVAFDSVFGESFAGDLYGIGSASLPQRVLEDASRAGLSLAVAESCTGGLLGSYLTEIPGASACFRGGVIVYDNATKTELLGVPTELLRQHGAVSEPVARAMARGVCSRLGCDIGVGITGVAGPDGGSPDKPVGTVHVVVAHGPDVLHRHLQLAGTRAGIRHRSAMWSLKFVWDHLVARGVASVVARDDTGSSPVVSFPPLRR